jgi:hypothetical protein
MAKYIRLLVGPALFAFAQHQQGRGKELILRLSKLKNDMITDDVINSLKNREKIIDIELLK